MSESISLFVILGTLGSLLVFFLILQLNRTVGKENQTTGHNYDGIEEYDNPLPAWWYWKFVFTIIFAIGYLIYYPGLGNFEGVGKWTSVGEYEQDQVAAEEKYGPLYAEYRESTLEEIAADGTARNMGRRLYANNCSVCHGADAKGSIGFPNLTDQDWLWGGSDEAITTTLMHGRVAAMPPWLDILGEQGVQDVSEYVLVLSGQEADQTMADRGITQYQTYCQACHGGDGKGNPMLGAPNLTDDIWLYGNTKDMIRHNIRYGMSGRMPAFDEKLGADRVRIVAGYIRSLSDER